MRRNYLLQFLRKEKNQKKPDNQFFIFMDTLRRYMQKVSRKGSCLGKNLGSKFPTDKSQKASF